MTANGNYAIPGPDNITRVELDNGIIVLAYENPAVQSVVISGSVHSGSLYEDPAKNGLASMTAGSLMRGTQNRDFDTLHSALEDIGADLSFNAHVHKVGFGGKALAEDLPTLLDILNDALRYPAFPVEHVELLRGEAITWLQYSEQDTRYQAARAFRENLFPSSHPYHYGTYGTLETLPALTVADLRAFHQQNFGPKGMILSVVGAVNAAEAVAMIRDRLEDWGNSEQPASPELPELLPIEETQRMFVPVPGKTQSDIAMGVIGPARLDPDYTAATIANSILGEFGMMGRLGKIIREKLGLAYYSYSRMNGGHGPGVWSVRAGVNPANVDLAIEKAQDELQRIASEPVSDEDIADNQSYFTGRLPLRLESSEGIANTLQAMESFELGMDYLVTYHDRIYSLTKDDLLAAAQRFLNAEALIIAVAGPENGASG